MPLPTPPPPAPPAAGVQEADLSADLGQAAAAPETEQLTELPRKRRRA